jgi:hypothetical protein
MAGFAFVADNSIWFDIPETEYREGGYTPGYEPSPNTRTRKQRQPPTDYERL